MDGYALRASIEVGGARRDRTDDLKLAKLRALPTELWPRSGRRHATGELQSTEPTTRTWWAWEDLNFRPHAYQARALTN